MSRYLDPKSDVVFKKVFGNNPRLLKSFLNAVLPLPEDRLIEELIYLTPEQVPELPMMKHPIVDVKCTDKQGRTFIVEMQIQWVTAFLQRLLFNTSAAYVHQLNRGEAYTNLSPVYGLALLAHNFTTEDPEWFHHYKMIHVKDNAKSLDDIQLVVVELPKFKPSTIQDKKLTILWLRFMKEISEKTRTVDPELLAVPEIMEAISLAEESAYTKGELAAYHTYWDSVSSEKTLIEGKLLEGEARGEARGLVKGEMNATHRIAKQMLEKKMPAELVAEITGLSLSEVKQLADSH